MKKLIEQMIKFGLVGVLCFMIDYGIYTGLCLIGVHYLIAAFFGFVISVVVNYILSMKFVFTRKADLDRKKEFVIFVILSVFGLALNEIIIWLCYDGIYVNVPEIQTWMSATAAKLVGKLVATALVMVYNFITRKIYLESKEK